MTPTTYQTMISLMPDVITIAFEDQYKFEYGEKKLIEVIRVTENSPKVDYYLKCLTEDKTIPSAQGIQMLMNTIGFFMFSKAETLCVGGLSVINLWGIKNTTIARGDKLAVVCADLIVNCSKTKINVTDNCFTRFFKKIDSMEDLSLKVKESDSSLNNIEKKLPNLVLDAEYFKNLDLDKIARI